MAASTNLDLSELNRKIMAEMIPSYPWDRGIPPKDEVMADCWRIYYRCWICNTEKESIRWCSQGYKLCHECVVNVETLHAQGALHPIDIDPFEYRRKSLEDVRTRQWIRRTREETCENLQKLSVECLSSSNEIGISDSEERMERETPFSKGTRASRSLLDLVVGGISKLFPNESLKNDRVDRVDTSVGDWILIPVLDPNPNINILGPEYDLANDFHIYENRRMFRRFVISVLGSDPDDKNILYDI